jgi:hypothetical protein
LPGSAKAKVTEAIRLYEYDKKWYPPPLYNVEGEVQVIEGEWKKL